MKMDLDITHQVILKMVGAVVGCVFSFILPIQSFIIFIGILVFTDLYTGVRVVQFQKKQGLDIRVTSAGFKRTVYKFKDYAIAILISHGLEIVFFPLLETPYFAWSISGVIALTEVKSIFENLTITTGIDFWEKMKENLQKKFLK